MSTSTKAQRTKMKAPVDGGTVEHIFVYGTLRNRAKAAERQLLAKHAARVGIGQVSSASLFLGEYPYAVPVKTNGSVLVGEVYRLDPDTRADILHKLDVYEEYDPKNPARSLYRREIVQVQVGKEHLSAWIYWYNKPLGNSPLLRHGNYLKTQMHVVPSGTGWQVKMAGTSRAEPVISNKVEAVKRARKLAGKNHMALVIHGRDGRIQERIPTDKE